MVVYNFKNPTMTTLQLANFVTLVVGAAAGKKRWWETKGRYHNRLNDIYLRYNNQLTGGKRGKQA